MLLSFKKPLCALALLAALPLSALAAPVTYVYTGPNFYANAERLVISITTANPLPASRSFLTQAAAGVTASSVKVVNAAGATLLNFDLPIQTLQLHTNSSGAIDAWYVFGGFNSLAGLAPTMTGVDRQAYTMNTQAFIPGSDIPGSTGLVTGAYAYDQATETYFYASCAGAPAGCTLAGNGQPYVGTFSRIINPSNSSPASWTVAGAPVIPPAPVPATPVTISGSLPGATVGVAYTAALSAAGGSGPYVWSVSNLPAGLSLNAGTISGTPTAAGSYSVGVTATNAVGTVGNASYALNVVNASCSGSNATVTAIGRNFLVVNGGLNLADHIWYTPTAAGTTFTGGLTTFATGEVIDWTGTMDPVAGCYATAMTVKPAATLSCSRPAAAKGSSGKAVVTSTGANFIIAGGKRIDHASCTLTQYGGRATVPAVGDRVEWQGYVESNGNVMASQLTFN
jgi:cytochrome c5